MTLKDRFLTQSAPDICPKLQKQDFGPNQSFKKLLQLAEMYIMVENTRRKKEPGQRLKPQQRLLDLLWNSLRKNAQRDPGKRDGLVVTMERKGISSRIALRHLSHPWIHVQSAKDHTGEETALQGVGPGSWTLKTVTTEGTWGSLHKLPS